MGRGESKERGVDSRLGPHNEKGGGFKYALSCTVTNHQPELLLNWNGGGLWEGGGGGLHPLPLVLNYSKEALMVPYGCCRVLPCAFCLHTWRCSDLC